MKYLVSIASLAIAGLAFSSTYAADTYTLDPQHSFIGYRVNHLGFSEQVGKWPATGTLILDKDKPENSKVSVKVNVGDLVTGIAELNKHLLGPLFFDAGQYPVATFVSTKVESTGNDTAKVYGTLTLRGVSKPVVLDVKLNKAGTNPITEKMTAGFSAKTQIKRSDYNVKAFVPAVSDEVALDIEAEAYKAS